MNPRGTTLGLTAVEAAVAKTPALLAKTRPGPVGALLDRVAREVSPAWARKRQQARAYLALGDGFDITRAGRQRRGRSYAGGPADRHLDEHTLFQLRETARDAHRNSPLMHGIIERWLDNLVGPTFSVSPLTEDEGWNRAAREYVEGRMGKSCDLRRREPFRRLVRTWMRAIALDGDVLAVFTEDGLATYEADQLASPWPAPRGNEAGGPLPSVLNGVQVDPRTGRDLGYFVAKREYRGFVPSNAWSLQTTFVPAAEALFIANTERASQTRGLPIIASALGMFDRFDHYMENEQIAAEVTSMILYEIQRADPAFFQDPATGEMPDWIHTRTSEDGTEQTLEKVEPGTIFAGALGDKVVLHNPQRPSAAFEPYTQTAMRMLGCGIGMPLELVLLDFSKTTYSSARAALLQAYRTFRVWQGFTVSEAIQPPYERWIGQGIADGDLTLRPDAFRAQYLMPQWAWVDPLKEILAAEKSVAMGIDCLQDYIEREYQTLGQYVQRRRTELRAFADAGIPTSTVPGGSAGAAAVQTDLTAVALKEP